MGTIYNIQRFSLHDGSGIRTTVFFKGCPLRCKWCHNPESQAVRPQISLFAERCIACGRCFEVCPVHSLQDGIHTIDFEKCIACGKCADACPSAALEIIGKAVTVEDIMKEADRDMPFYDTSSGGITLSGGDPTMQPDFAAEVLKAAKEKGIHTAMETCGYVDFKALEKILPWLDQILYDVKQMDPALHELYTGKDNVRILENLSRICTDAYTTEVVIRTPVIPGFNDQKENFRALAAYILALPRRPRVEVLPYNPLAGSKYPRMGMVYTPGTLTEEDGTPPAELCAILQEAGIEAKVIR